MNLLETEVIQILSKPYMMYGKYFINVIADCYGSKFETKIICNSVNEALSVGVGFKFMS